MDDLMSEFVAETRETLDAIAGEIVAWESAPGDRGRLDSIFRFVHTVKGSCGFLDLPRLERLSHAAEDALASVRSEVRQADAALVSAVLRIIDRIGEIVEAIESGGTVPDADDDTLILALTERAEPGASAAPLAATSHARSPSRSIRLPVELLDRMMGGVSDMVLARNELFRRLREVSPDTSLEAAFDRLSACVAEMRDAITRTRMQRIENLFTALPRMVRDLSADLGKSVRLEIDGGDVELDREMIEMIRDPLTHIIRNAIDHGIEAPAERKAMRKPATGTLRVCARQAGNQILIDVADDGRGIDADRLVAKAISAGVLSDEASRRLNDAARLDLIFHPGLSTAGVVTAVSGRGVGMDVVRANIERIGGVVDLENRPGQGLRLTLRVPLTLTIIPALTVGSGIHQFAIPRSAIEEIVRADATAIRIEQIGGAVIANIRGRRLAVVSLATTLGEPANEAETTLVVLRPAGGALFALAVESVHDHEELVVKPAAPAVMATGLYAGATLPDSGRPMLLLDTAGLARAGGVRNLEERAPDEVVAVAEPEAEQVRILLFRDLDGVERGVRLALVERIEDVPARAISLSAGRLRLVRDGQVLPLVTAIDLPARDCHRVLRLGDGSSEVAYAIGEVIDIASLSAALLPVDGAGSIAGLTLVAGRPVEILDPFTLFARAARPRVSAIDRQVCLLAGDGPWMREILAPLVEQAGYRVAWPNDPSASRPAIIIEMDGAAAAAQSSSPVIRLRSSIEPSPQEGSIYRYDREALLTALRRAPAGVAR